MSVHLARALPPASIRLVRTLPSPPRPDERYARLRPYASAIRRRADRTVEYADDRLGRRTKREGEREMSISARGPLDAKLKCLALRFSCFKSRMRGAPGIGVRQIEAGKVRRADSARGGSEGGEEAVARTRTGEEGTAGLGGREEGVRTKIEEREMPRVCVGLPRGEG